MTQETAGSINVFVRSSYREVKYNQTIHGKCNYSGLWVLRAKIESHAINRQGIQNLIPVQLVQYLQKILFLWRDLLSL
jgi:hypothetical protein